MGKKLNLAVLFSLLIFGLITGSRNFIFNFILIVFLIIFLSRKNKKNLKILLSIIFLVLIIYFLPVPFIQDFKDILFDRILNPKDGDISGGRILLWTEYIKYTFKSPDRILFGIGSNDYHIRSGVGNVAHNIVLGSIVSQGVFGFTLMMLLYYHLFRKNFQSHIYTSQKRMIFISIVVLVFSYFTLDALGNYVSIVGITLIAGLSSFPKEHPRNLL